MQARPIPCRLSPIPMQAYSKPSTLLLILLLTLATIKAPATFGLLPLASNLVVEMHMMAVVIGIEQNPDKIAGTLKVQL